MLLFRWLILMFLLMAGVSFAFYVATGKAHFKHFGLVVLKWVVLSGLGFFAILILERIA